MDRKKTSRIVYLDHAATTPVDKDVLRVMLPYFSKWYGNPSALNQQGLIANGAINDSRRVIAQILGTLSSNIIFCSGGTESDNLAVYGICYANQSYGKHIVTTPVEHSAILEPLEDLVKKGWEVTFVKVNKDGMVDPRDVYAAIRPDTVLVSVMYANNEIGTIEPIVDIGKSILHYRKEHSSSYPYFHTDACQAAPYLDLNVERLHVDLLTLNGGKIYGPKGIGLLFVRRGIVLHPLLRGGNQEGMIRAGTENVPGIVGLAKALEVSQKKKREETERLAKLSHYFYKKLQQFFPGIILHGPPIGEFRLVNNLHVYFPNAEADKLLLYLDAYGIMCSAKSACHTNSLNQSHVLKAIGLSFEEAKQSIRFSLGKSSTKMDIDYVINVLKQLKSQLLTQ